MKSRTIADPVYNIYFPKYIKDLGKDTRRALAKRKLSRHTLQWLKTTASRMAEDAEWCLAQLQSEDMARLRAFNEQQKIKV